MGVFYHEELSNHPKKCKYFAAILKEVFSHCQTFSRQLSSASLEEEWSISDLDEEQEVVIVSTVRSRIMERRKHKPNLLTDNFSVLSSPAARELYFTQTMEPQERKEGDEEDDEIEFLSVKSCFSCCSSSAMSMEAFYSVKTNLSSCSSKNDLELSKNWRRSIIQEFCHCEGWPFGLCRKAILLPPLPKSPSDSWLSSKIQRRTKDA
ncbi:hypothetical protein Lal_00045823 [Lupinus albus]|uniref:Uncharacterized protein n=1 Tax=Lupinus albus TaxID=3870 RepID=A0A6A5NTD7_LUPAL|nr:hypothetical protein Lalb_Chr14g0368791 [Lupinus albus]KAF1886590.1 hypothetical protein Lal_00045823 [Lupinus albus]